MNEKSIASAKEFSITRQVGLFRKLKEKFFTGELVVRTMQGTESHFYLYMGRIVYATGGIHPMRRYRRLLNVYCPQAWPEFYRHLQANLFSTSNQAKGISWEYLMLSTWLDKGILSRHQVAELTKNLISEILFDLSLVPKVTYELRFSSCQINPPIIIDVEQAITQSNNFCNAWQQTELRQLSPNLAPCIKNAQQLKEKVSLENYEVLERHFNGRLSLRELSSYLRQDLLNIVRAISNYIMEGLLELIEIPDLPNPSK